MSNNSISSGMPVRPSSWMYACLALSFCIVSKEAVRYMALWQFEQKTPLLLAIILVVTCALLLSLNKNASVRSFFCDENDGMVLLSVLQSIGLSLRFAVSLGIEMPLWASYLSYVLTELSLVSLAICMLHAVRFGWSEGVEVISWGLAIAGMVQMVLVFIDSIAGRLVLVVAPLLMTGFFIRSRSLQPMGSKGSFGDISSNSDAKGEKAKAMHFLAVFLVSVVLMGAYSQWRPAQDGMLVSALLQLSSGFGLMIPAVVVAMAAKFASPSSLYFAGQAIVFPVALGALYLSSVFDGIGMAFSILLFDSAYSVILLFAWVAVWKAPSADSLLIIVGGLISYKVGWFIGVWGTTGFTSSIPWLGTFIVAIAFIALLGVSSTTLFLSFRGVEKQRASCSDDAARVTFEEACALFAESIALTKRERDVLALLARGRTASYIARDLVVSEPTARTHISHIYRKAGVNSQQQLIDLFEEVSERAALDMSRVASKEKGDRF
ncbi:hypothetical protein DMP06_03690 [Slackia equolifaciens]|uniref:HTH luxR-type domain-containing protein n=1 Tax=Slackia equolifaciens TaxID=498718 RepID=A0A3N0B0Y3_9ACTN|nr:helix-turn-helix transcriptional regulator [Slackia equolifaciens]RNL40787.1 hypothetical protein DMP06_03690 [Slackia equolifaciens]